MSFTLYSLYNLILMLLDSNIVTFLLYCMYTLITINIEKLILYYDIDNKNLIPNWSSLLYHYIISLYYYTILIYRIIKSL